MKRKKVLVVINLFESARNFVGGQFRYLYNNGYEMHLICSPHPDLQSYASENNLSAYPILLNRQLTPWQDFKSLIQIYRYIRKHKIDIVIGHQVKGRLLSTIASFFARADKTIIFSHGAIHETSKGIKRKLLIWESKLESLLSDKVVCVSPYIRDLRRKEKIDNPAKQVILGLGTCGGIDTKNRFNKEIVDDKKLSEYKNKYDIKESDFIIGFVGRLVKDKGVIELIDAFNLLKNKFPEKKIKLMVVGAPERRDGLPEKLLSFLQESNDIVYTGFIDLEEMKYQYLCMDCLVLPSHREGFGMCNIEAQAMGKPVLTSKHTGCRDSILPGITGLYISLDKNDIAEKISFLMKDEIRINMGKRGCNWVQENFDHSVIWPYFKMLLDSLSK